MPLETTKWDTAEILDSPEMIASYIEAVMEDADPALITLALGNIARSKGMSDIARKTGITREGLYKALSAEGDPKLSTFLGVIRSLGLQISVKPAREPKAKGKSRKAAKSRSGETESLRRAS